MQDFVWLTLGNVWGLLCMLCKICKWERLMRENDPTFDRENVSERSRSYKKDDSHYFHSAWAVLYRRFDVYDFGQSRVRHMDTPDFCRAQRAFPALSTDCRLAAVCRRTPRKAMADHHKQQAQADTKRAPRSGTEAKANQPVQTIRPPSGRTMILPSGYVQCT